MQAVLGVAGVVVIVPVGLAWACVGLVSLTTSSPTVDPGATVTVFGKEFAAKVPVLIHLDSITGPVLATVPPPTPSTMTSQFKIDVTIPADVSRGQHLLIATQDEHDMNGGNPARALIGVGVAAPGARPEPLRPVALVSDAGPSTSSLVLIGLGVAGVSLLLSGSVLAVMGRRQRELGTIRVP
ncbi:MAG: hypothetical protein NVSMB4_02850 [Acidimicrobiales bacterium]